MKNQSRDRKYLDWLRTQPCIVTLTESPPERPSSEPAHLRLLAEGGTAIKPPDWLVLPLHWRLHREGETTKAFWRRMIDEYPDLLPRLLLEVAKSRYDNWKITSDHQGDD